MPSAGFEPEIKAIKLPHTYALDRTAFGIYSLNLTDLYFSCTMGQNLVTPIILYPWSFINGTQFISLLVMC